MNNICKLLLALPEMGGAKDHADIAKKQVREKRMLELENAILRLERRLPPGKPPKEK